MVYMGSSDIHIVFYSYKVNQMSTKNSWGLPSAAELYLSKGAIIFFKKVKVVAF